MTTPTFLPPEQVREIAKRLYLTHSEQQYAVDTITAVAPEITRIALEFAAKEFETVTGPNTVANRLRQLAKEIADGK